MATARAQSPPSDQSPKVGQTAGKQAQTQSNRGNTSPGGEQGAGAAQGQAGRAQQPPARREFSEAYRESLRRTVQKRRELRARRRMGSEASQPAGAIALWPMPPSLIIRQTREVHSEINSFLDVLRR